MRIQEFDFNLPENLIAQTPLKDRTASRLFVLDKATKKIEHKHFKDIKDYLKEGDCLVLNDTRVLPARLYGTKKDTNANVEVLLLHQQEKDRWEVLVKPAKKVKPGTVIHYEDTRLQATYKEIKVVGDRVIDITDTV